MIQEEEEKEEEEEEEGRNSEFKISTVETRLFDCNDFASPVEVEFHRNPAWGNALGAARAVDVSDVDGDALVRLAARGALTGSVLPPMLISRSNSAVPLAPKDPLTIALTVAKFGALPTQKDCTSGSEYLRLREAIELALDLKHIDLELRVGQREEERVTALAKELGIFSLATASSPELGFVKFVELVAKNKRIFGLSAAGGALLGTSALASAYQLAVVADPIIAVQIALGGSVAYVVLKIGASVGKQVEKLIK